MPQKAPPGTKFCVFCGRVPSAKNREHIVPRWLLELTGGHRHAYFGRQWSSPSLEKRTYSWESFAFPACEACNSRWADLEANIHSIMRRMGKGSILQAADFYKLLDWFDKVRVGLWLAMIYLNGNYRAIIPQFHIDDRVGSQDRMLLIYEGQEPVEGIAMVGIDSPIFHTMPSAMYFVINQLHFISLSKPFLLAERFGWPIVRNMKMKDIDTDGFSGELVAGSGEIAPAIIDTLPAVKGTVLLQPIAHPAGRDEEPYAHPHVIATSQPAKKAGKLFIGNAPTSPYPEEESAAWKPPEKYPFDELSPVLTSWTASMQEGLFLHGPDYSHFPETDRKKRDAEIAGIVKLHRMMVAHDMKSSSNAP
jgi:hypothetical protein